MDNLYDTTKPLDKTCVMKILINTLEEIIERRVQQLIAIAIYT